MRHSWQKFLVLILDLVFVALAAYHHRSRVSPTSPLAPALVIPPRSHPCCRRWPPSLSSLVTVDLVRRRYSHPCRCPHPLRSLLVLATIALVAVAPLLSLLLALRWRWLPTLAPCITPGLALGRMRALTASFSHLPCDSLLASARTAANSIYYLPQLHAALDL